MTWKVPSRFGIMLAHVLEHESGLSPFTQGCFTSKSFLKRGNCPGSEAVSPVVSPAVSHSAEGQSGCDLYGRNLSLHQSNGSGFWFPALKISQSNGSTVKYKKNCFRWFPDGTRSPRPSPLFLETNTGATPAAKILGSAGVQPSPRPPTATQPQFECMTISPPPIAWG